MFNCLVEMISPNKRNPRTPQEEKSRAIRKYRISAMRIGISRAKKIETHKEQYLIPHYAKLFRLKKNMKRFAMEALISI